MGEGTPGVADQPEDLERRVETIRGDLDAIVAELDRRRRELLDWRLQLRRHRGAVVAIFAGVLTIAALSIWRAGRGRG